MTTRRAASASFVLALALAACGGGGGLTTAARSSASSSSSAPATASTATTITPVFGSDSSSTESQPPITVDAGAGGADDAGAGDVTPVVVSDAQPGPADLIGSWLGPMPGDTGRCGSAVSEWTLAADGSYQVTNRSTECGGFTVFGTYSADDSTIAFEQQGSDCPTCIQTASYSVDYSFISDVNSLEIVDGPQSFVLHRQ